MRDDFGSWLRWAREEAGISQRDLAAILNVTDATISHWECGRRAPEDHTIPGSGENYVRAQLERLLRGKK
jgi:transcriptional regulator with XRE-family HTH domain